MREHEERAQSSSSLIGQMTTDIATNYTVDASIEYFSQFIYNPNKTVKPLDTKHHLPTYKSSSGEIKDDTSTQALYMNESNDMMLNQKLIGMTIVIYTSDIKDLPPPSSKSRNKHRGSTSNPYTITSTLVCDSNRMTNSIVHPSTIYDHTRQILTHMLPAK